MSVSRHEQYYIHTKLLIYEDLKIFKCRRFQMLNQKIAALILPLDLFDALGKTICQQPSGLIKLLYPDANSKNSFHHNTLVIGHLPTNSVSISLVVQVHYFIRVNAISYNYKIL